MQIRTSKTSSRSDGRCQPLRILRVELTKIVCSDPRIPRKHQRHRHNGDRIAVISRDREVTRWFGVCDGIANLCTALSQSIPSLDVAGAMPSSAPPGSFVPVALRRYNVLRCLALQFFIKILRCLAIRSIQPFTIFHWRHWIYLFDGTYRNGQTMEYQSLHRALIVSGEPYIS